jgi:drug/metabolite transporter (DMT)-like permease
VGAATAAMVAWGLTGILVVLTKEPGLVVALERLVLGVPFVGVLLAVTGRRLDWSTFWRTVPGGVLLCADVALFFSAVKLTSIADATVIGALQPALVLFVAGPLFGEKPVRADFLWTAVAIAGVGVVVLGSGGTGHHQVLGDLLALASVCSWTGYWLVSKQARLVRRPATGDEASISPGRQAIGTIEYTSGVMVVAPVAMVPVALVSGQHFTVGTPTDWLWIGLMTLGPGGAHLASNWAHRFVGVTVSSVIVAANPVVAAGAAAVFLHQSLGLMQIIGGLAAIMAVAVVAGRAVRIEAVEAVVA